MPQTRSRTERLASVNETKLKIIELDLMNDLATQILFKMLDNYHAKGTTYLNKELTLVGRHAVPRKYVVNLYNDSKKKDIVLIRTLDEKEEEKSNAARSQIAIERNARDVQHTWKRDEDSGSDSDSDDEEPPELIRG